MRSPFNGDWFSTCIPEERTVSRRLPEHTAIASTDSKSQIQEEFGLLELASWSHAFCLREAMLYLRELYYNESYMLHRLL